MRVLMVLLALVALPLLGLSAQGAPWATNNGQGNAFGAFGDRGRGHDAEHCEKRKEKHKDKVKKGKEKTKDKRKDKCDLSSPPTEPPGDDPPPSDDPPPPSGGTASMEGWVYQAADPWPGLSGWVVTVTGTVNTTTSTDAEGNWTVTGLPAGSYTVCLDMQSGWVQTFPSSGAACPSGVGYSFTLTDGSSALFLNFGNVRQ